jgi:hypothetical protein
LKSSDAASQKQETTYNFPNTVGVQDSPSFLTSTEFAVLTPTHAGMHDATNAKMYCAASTYRSNRDAARRRTMIGL